MKRYLTKYVIEANYRVLYTLISFFLNFIIIFSKRNTIITFLSYPLLLDYQQLIATNVGEIFTTHLSVCANLSVLISFPFVVYQVSTFISNAWYTKEKKDLINFTILSTSSFTVGIICAHLFILPLAWHFFSEFQLHSGYLGLNIQNEVRVSMYADWALTLIFICANLSFTPFYILLCIRENIEDRNIIWIRKNFIIIAVILSALVAPPDGQSQFLIASWLIISYELSVLYLIKIRLTAF
nr:Sec-independent protein translocase protein [Cavernulicola chilensis]